MTDEELRKQLREVTGGKLFFTNTPNHLRLTAADRIEQLGEELELAQGATNHWIVAYNNMKDKLAEIKGET